MDASSFDKHWKISELLVKQLNGKLTSEEQRALDQWLLADPANQALFDRLLDEETMKADLELMNSFDAEQGVQKIAARIHLDEYMEAQRKHKRMFYFRVGASIAALLVISFLIIVFTGRQPEQLAAAKEKVKTTIEDSTRLYLTLADGSKIDLETADKGVISQQSGAVITKSENGVLNYDSDQAVDATDSYNTLSVPKGKRFEMILPDGSKVWLNALTTVKYPVSFNKQERVVELNGEAYFEVAHNPGWPFKVKTGNQVVEVLGTHFNVEAYAGDSKINTTLAEGNVRVVKGSSVTYIKPGQTAVNDLAAPDCRVKKADLETVLAWRNGMFYFKDERIEEIMKKVSRIYNVQVEFNGDIRDKRFWATYPIDRGLENFLKNLEQTNAVHFDLQPGKLIVKP
jgi:ferric-dicitrate binding protein FerR (iron transport regulator)